MGKQSILQATSPLLSWLTYLEHLHSQPIELGLERVGQVAQALSVLKPANRVFTVAGTNGKGTTCRTLETILLSAGYRVGVYSSPHLLDYTERVRIQGARLPEDQHCRAFAAVEAQRGDISLTYFEYGTLAALWLFQQALVEVVILEVGLGGRLDATNIVTPNVAVITCVALDHMDWLGADRESIGREKAGIFRPGIPAIYGEVEMPASVAKVAEQQGAHLYRCGRDWHFSAQPRYWQWQNQAQQWGDLPLPHIPLPNAAAALAALHYSGLVINKEAIVQGLAQASLPGRFQIVVQQPLLILDVAHNPHAANYLAQQLQRLIAQPEAEKRSVRVVIGMLADKDIPGTLACLRPWVDYWYCATLAPPRGSCAESLSCHLSSALVFDTVEMAWRQAMQEALPQDIVLVCGSFYTVAEVMKVLKLEKLRGE